MKSSLFIISCFNRAFFVAPLILVGNSCFANNQEQQAMPKETWITIFIHGTLILKPTLLAENIAPIMGDKAHETRYGTTIKCARKNPILFQNQAMQEQGLHKINIQNLKPGNASATLALLYDKALEDTQGESQQNSYYTFGWSGLISSMARLSAGKLLHEQLDQEIAKFKEQGVIPKVRLIGYSHGGNVSLNLARCVPTDNIPWHVNELILVATPILDETDFLITHPVFKDKYSLFSEADRVQAMDFFSFKRFFSNRQFKERHDLALPDSLTQIQIKVRKHIACSHEVTPTFTSGAQRILSPGHAEFWFFGWTTKNYRKRYPLYPLPTIAFLPYVLKEVKTAKEKEEITYKDPVIATLVPAYELMSLKNKNDSKEIVRPFIKIQNLNELKNLVTQFEPPEFKNNFYKERSKICTQGQRLHKQMRKGKLDS